MATVIRFSLADNRVCCRQLLPPGPQNETYAETKALANACRGFFSTPELIKV
jgi:hypothetical protein